MKRFALLSYNGAVFKNSLEALGYSVILLPSYSKLAMPVSSHADMLIAKADSRLFLDANYYSENEHIFSELKGYEIIKTNEGLCSPYPKEVLYNSCILKKHIICKKGAASTELLDHAVNFGRRPIFVKQGYCGCSCCKVGDNAIITADKGIYNAAKSEDINALLIKEGHIGIENYNYGFIGGASGSDGENVYFCGNIDLHPDSVKIKEFIIEMGYKPVCLSDSPLFDIGGILFL